MKSSISIVIYQHQAVLHNNHILFVIAVLSFFIARSQGSSPIAIIGEHVLIAMIVVVASHYIGAWVNTMFS